MVAEDPGALPLNRLRTVTERPARPRAAYVLYWMTAARRPTFNFALQRAAAWARSLHKPLVVFEALRCDYPFASDRLHRFILDGMCDNEESFRERPALYYPYVEDRPGAGRGLLKALSSRACVVVTDDSPTFFLPRMLAAAAKQVDVRMEAVDGHGLLPLSASSRVFPSAAVFRRFLKAQLPLQLEARPKRDPLARLDLPLLRKLGEVTERWPMASRGLLDGDPKALAALPIDHAVGAVEWRGGHLAAARRMQAFLRHGLHDYPDARAHPEVDGTSRLSPYLHFGHTGIHEILSAIERRERKQRRTKEGLFGLSEPAEAFLDELVTWRELGANLVHKLPEPGAFTSLPGWAQTTLNKHRKDPRPRLQTFRALEAGTTPDVLFNAAQTQLREEGWFHNAMRMIWGKKLLEYSASPEEALERMRRLMDRWSLDGRDPNSVSGATWVLGRYDRPWGPERPVFGTVRFMTSDTKDKLRRYREYVERWSPRSPS